MPRIDSARISQQWGAVFANHGETATLREYVSASAGRPQFGLASQPQYRERTITALFGTKAIPLAREAQVAGGLTMSNELRITTDLPLDPRSEIVWRGTAYRVDGQGTPQVMGGRVMWWTPIKAANSAV